MPARVHGAIYGRKQIGGAWYNKLWDGLKKGFNWVKDNKIASKVLTAVGQPTAANVAGQLGFGRKKKRRTMGTRVQIAGRRSRASTSTSGRAMVVF